MVARPISIKRKKQHIHNTVQNMKRDVVMSVLLATFYIFQ